MDENLRRLSMAIESTGDSGTTCHMTKGIVVATSVAVTPPTCSIQLSGDTTTTIAGVRFVDSYWPVVGDVVQIIKQSSTLLIIGQVSVWGATPADQGWVSPTPATNWALDAIDPLRYRVIQDHGTRKVQLRGALTRSSGTPTTLWTMPAEARPVVNLKPVLISRGWGGGAVSAQMQINSSGTMVLDGYTAGVASVNGTTGNSSPDTGVSTGDGPGGTHRHYEYNGSAEPAGDGGGFTDWNGAHTHTVNSHNHSITSTGVSHPDWVGFNGIEYFL